MIGTAKANTIPKQTVFELTSVYAKNGQGHRNVTLGHTKVKVKKSSRRPIGTFAMFY